LSQRIEVAAHESLFLGAIPPLEFALVLNGIRDPLKPLREHEFDRPT
jgi:hypothetical protein